ncbi:FixH family protein [Afifella sp. IM 167]|uniref:FixH family protein n=1 Tax=Afifella sp. IM 167 TaxID=2033586 RepID=UPI001CCDCBA7|nr:FixH family protein [Afifella sp. IM 167]MBZ8132075.1 nitrogen fixation protein FixH [Afifella sp. IM 167]
MNRVTRFFRIGENHPLTGAHALAIIVAFFVVVIVVNVTMAALATGTFPGLIVENSYVASQNYNTWLKEARAQDERGWRADLDARDGRLKVNLTDRSGTPITGIDLSAIIGRASTDEQDRVVPLSPEDGVWRAPGELTPGLWMVELKAKSGDQLLYRVRRAVTVAPRAG